MIPAPPTDTARPVAFYDTECYPNFWLLKFKTPHAIYTFALYEGQTFGDADIDRISCLFGIFTVISFNGNGYDVPMLTGALLGYTPLQLKWLNDQIIVDKVKPWELNLPEWKPADHIDIMEVCPGTGSQKQYAGRIHYKTMRDLPYDPATVLAPEQMQTVAAYCENDLGQLEALYNELRPQLQLRAALGERYGIDLRSKSDAQLAETVLRARCEKALGRRIYKPEIDWNLAFHYSIPDFIAFQSLQLLEVLAAVRESVFRLSPNGSIAMPPQLEGRLIPIGSSVYKIGIGGLHSQEKSIVHISDNYNVLRDNDVAAYYPSLILNSGAWPPALGEQFLVEFGSIKNERLAYKEQAKALKKAGRIDSPEYEIASTGDGGGKIQINGTFGKTGSIYSILFAPQMLIQTTLTGQLSLLMLIEWLEYYGIPVVSANTDGIVTKCPRHLVATADALIAEWQKRTGLEMETVEYVGLYSRDVNNYFAVKPDGEVKRKGEYSQAGLVEKKNPDVEICSDAVAEFLAHGTPIVYSIAACRDIRKFVTIQRVNGGAVKMWGEGPRKDAKVRDMIPTLEACGWVAKGRKWHRLYESAEYLAGQAYELCFAPQRPEYLGKVVRWYYGTRSPGPIVYASNGNTVSLSYGAQPCMTLPDEFPDDIDYQWYVDKANAILVDIGK